MNTQAALRPYDVVLVGGGIMSATLGILLKHVEPTWSIAVYERLPELAAEASAPWNNAGTGHAGLCELEYTSENPDGGIDIARAVTVNEHFQQSRQLWASLVEAEILGKPDTFISPVPHMALVHGTDDVDFLRRRFETLSAQPLFSGMRFSAESKTIEGWSPLLTERRGLYEPFAATRDVTGTDVDYGSLTRQMFAYLEASGVEIHRRCEVRGMRKNNDGSWQLRIHQFTDNDRLTRWVDTRFVFAGAGGWALKLLQNAGLPQVQGYGLLPVSGRFLRCDNPELVAQHHAKVYGRAKRGALPISLPHLDTRVIDGKRALLFGPYAGANPKLLKHGSMLDTAVSLRSHNVGSLASVHKGDSGLIRLLLTQMTATRGRKMAVLREFAPAANTGDWTMIKAGQYAQLVKRDANGRGVLEFGTEVVSSADGSIAGVLGASSEASSAVSILLDVLERCFPRYRGLWAGSLRDLIPSLGQSLAADTRLARHTMSRTAEVLGLVAPDNLP
ncbi:malate dehydrogenase (quinone) [Nocardia sp. NPDC058058]|uniref:malate dehydrogenase (quinone) n=1 Tax=Nocardia sp. NPDC058058 TaxID=3346317 RepID=UPI0036DE40C2